MISTFLRRSQVLKHSRIPQVCFSTLHQTSITGFGDKSKASKYDALRPSYPRQAIRSCIEPIFQAYEEAPFSCSPDTPVSQSGTPRINYSSNSIPPLRILELGSGTGLSTRAILDCLWEEASEAVQFELHCVEPIAAMRQQFRDSMIKESQQDGKAYYIDPEMISISNGSATSIPYPDLFFHGCIAAQSFHWFSTDEAVQSIVKKLTPNGVFVAVWNDYCVPNTWHGEAFETIIWGLYQSKNVPHFRSGESKQALQDNNSLGPCKTVEIPGQTYWFTEDEVRERMRTVSVVVELPQPEQDQTLDRIVDIAKRYAAEAESRNTASGSNDESVYKDSDGVRYYRMDYAIQVLSAQKKHLVN